MKISDFEPEELSQFRHYQQTCYEILAEQALSVRVGMSEKQVARQLHETFKKHGVRSYFHVPVALFGTRTAYPGNFGPFEALATDRVLVEGENFILDAAPIFDGYTVDCSYAHQTETSPLFQELDLKLLHLRQMIFDSAILGQTMQKIAWKIDDQIKEWGDENCHKKHIAAVLGHRVTKVSPDYLGPRTIWGLAPRQVGWFFAATALAQWGMRRWTPNWNHTAASDCPVQKGLWAVEPHIGRDGVGVKFEEILVVTDNEIFWLDDRLPHHKRWQGYS